MLQFFYVIELENYNEIIAQNKSIVWLKDVDQLDRHHECSYDVDQVDQHLLIRISETT